ncbi:PadR family transcriptional regulator [candidate division KSB1 bacterium]
MEFLSRLEEIYLLAIWRLKGNAYGVKIKKEVAGMSGKNVSYGALYFALEQLYNKGYVSRTKGEPTPVRGGCSKIYYSLTPSGRFKLKEAHQLQHSIWNGISVLPFEEGMTE